MHRKIHAVSGMILIMVIILSLFISSALAAGSSDFDPSRPVGSGYDEVTENADTENDAPENREIFVSSVMGEGSIIAIAVLSSAAIIMATITILIKRKKENRE